MDDLFQFSFCLKVQLNKLVQILLYSVMQLSFCDLFKVQAAYEKVVHGNQSQEPSKQLEIHFENYLRFLVKHQVNSNVR